MITATRARRQPPPGESRESDASTQAPRPSGWLHRIPFRLRLTLSFAVVMIVLFGGLALLLQTQFGASIDQSINRSLHTHAQDVAQLIGGSKKQLPQLTSPEGSFAQIVD